MELFDTVITEEAKQKVRECLDSGYISEGKLVKEFENALFREFGYRGVAVNSGTSALQLAVHDILGEDDEEIIIPAQTFIATGMAVLQEGAKVVFADIDVETGKISVEDVKRKITHKTKGVISVAWGGNPPNLEALENVCRDANIFLIQDNAQALGARYKGKPVTDFGDYSCFSFQATKHLTTGDGGLIVANEELTHEILRMLRWFGIDRDEALPDITGERQYDLYDIGFKYHMNDYAAALGLGNLVDIHDRIEKRRVITRFYDSRIKNVFISKKEHGSSCWVYDILVERRDDFCEAMRSRGVPVSVVHRGIHHHPVFEWEGELPNQGIWDEKHVCLPCHSSLTDEDVMRVVDAVNAGW